MKNYLRLFFGIIVVLLIVIIFKTLSFTSLQVKTESVRLPVIEEKCAGNLSKAISYKTISYDVKSPVDTNAFRGLHQFISEAYPLINNKLKKEIFSDFSLLYTWSGKDTTLKPVIFTAHMDVVPVGEAGSWTKPPFSGENDGTYVWGRGTLDDKGEMIMILEAVEKLLGENYQPERTIYLAFGHDEEISGLSGATVIASTLKARGVKAEFVFDEGSAITVGMVPMIAKPVALIGTSEKGYLSVNLTVELPGGHSAFPGKESAITVLTKALNKLVNNQMKARISKPVDDFVRYIGPEMPFYARVIFANQWLFNGVILKIYKGSKTSNALVRTTTAPTIINAGSKENVIPTKAEAVVNFRILPGDASADVIEHLKNVISDDRVRISILPGLNEPPPVSPIDVLGFNTIVTTVRQIYPDALIAPTLIFVASDSRKYIDLTRNIYNLAPIVVTSEDMTRIHGVDERIKIKDLKRGIMFYYQLVKNSNR
jgi:carboxypeptidase PM20D1